MPKRYDENIRVLGIDEAGLGCLAGPAVVSGVIFGGTSDKFTHLNDSKQMTPARRKVVYDQLTASENIKVYTEIVSVEEIDSLNILKARLNAVARIIEQAKDEYDLVIIDGDKIPEDYTSDDKVMCIIKGDGIYSDISAASVIAKVTRDDIMVKYHEKYPDYGFDKHKGYSTKLHISNIEKCGICPIHRKTFGVCKKYQ